MIKIKARPRTLTYSAKETTRFPSPLGSKGDDPNTPPPPPELPEADLKTRRGLTFTSEDKLQLGVLVGTGLLWQVHTLPIS